MRSAAVKMMDSMQAYATRRSDKRQGDLLGDFSDVFGKATSQQQMAAQTDSFSNGNLKSRVESLDQKGFEQRSSLKTDRSSETQSSKACEELQSKAEEAGKKMVSAVAKELGVSEEEVVKAMEALGIGFVDLLNADHLTQLVLSVKGVDALALMTNEGLYNSLKSLLGALADLQKELASQLGITPAELNMLLEQMASEEALTGSMNGTVQEETMAGADDYSVMGEQDGEVVKVSVEVDGNVKSENSEMISGKLDTDAMGQGEKESSNSQMSFGKEESETNLLLQNLMNHEAAVKMDGSFEQVMAGRAVTTQDIMNQIMEYMRVHIKADMTQMEIHLHPASLGTVNVNITAKEGVITAQFLAQNEAVKAAIESQLVQLRNTFEEQGIKVDAVEVTVETHEFERNLSGEGNQQQESYGEKKKGTRRINLKEIDLETEELALSEEEQIAVSMMSIEGNTVDYMA